MNTTSTRRFWFPLALLALAVGCATTPNAERYPLPEMLDPVTEQTPIPMLDLRGVNTSTIHPDAFKLTERTPDVLVEVAVPMTAWGVPRGPCIWCGDVARVEVHHIQPQHIRPDLIWDTNNMVRLCRECHFRLGHKCNWQSSVTNLLRMIEEGQR